MTPDEIRIINSKVANFMGWQECYDDNDNLIDKEKMDSIIGLSYYADYPLGGYNPCNFPEQCIKVVDKLISLGFRIGMDNFNDLWEVEIVPTDKVTIPFCGHVVIEQDNNLYAAICTATVRLLDK